MCYKTNIFHKFNPSGENNNIYHTKNQYKDDSNTLGQKTETPGGLPPAYSSLSLYRLPSSHTASVQLSLPASVSTRPCPMHVSYTRVLSTN